MRFSRLLLLLLLFLSAASAAPENPAAPGGPSLLPGAGDALSAARADLDARRLPQAMNRLEPLLISGALDEAGRDLLARVYEESCNGAYARKDYRQAILNAQKLLALKPDERKMISILHNLYFRGGYFTEGIAYGRHLIENAGKIGLPAEESSKVHGRQAMLYAAIGETDKSVAALAESWRLAADKASIRNYLKHIVPALIPREKFAAAAREARNGPPEALAALAAEAGGPLPPASAGADPDAGIPVALVVRSTRPVELGAAAGDRGTAEAEFAPKREIYLEHLEEGDRQLGAGRFDAALRAYDLARETAPPAEGEKISRKRFSAYFEKNRTKIEVTGYAVIALLAFGLLYLLGFFRVRGQYGVVAPGKILARGAKFIEKENWDAAIAEYSKVPEASLGRDESIKVSLNLGLAYMAKNGHSNAILHARRALAKDPGNVDASLILGKVYLKTGDKTSRAMEVFEFLADRNLANVRMLKELAAWFLKNNVVSEKSSKVANDVLRFEPDEVISGQLVAKWYHHNNRTDDEAVEAVTRLAEKLPRDVSIKLILLEMHFRRKDYKAVVRESMYIFPLNGDNVIVHSLFIDALVRLQQFKVLLSEYQRLLAENPGSIVVKYIYQSLYSLLVKKKQYPETDVALSLKVNFTVCPKCFHLNLTEFHHCQKCKAQLTP